MSKITPNELVGLKQQRDTIIQQLNHLNNARQLENNALTQFTLDTQIQDLESQKNDINKKIEEAESSLQGGEIKQTLPQVPSGFSFDKNKLEEIHCYCCNRDDHFDQVLQFLEEKQAENLLHIFLPSYPHDAPESLLTRVVYHYYPENNFYAPGARHGEHVNTMKLVETPLRPTPRVMLDLAQEINKYIQPQFSENIVLFYRLDLESWKSKQQYKTFVVDIHANKLPTIPGKKIRIFYWLDSTRCPIGNGFIAKMLSRNSNPVSSMKEACSGKEQICFLEPLAPVRQLDLQAWFSWLCFYPTIYNNYIADIFNGREHLPMGEVEPHLCKLFQQTNRYR